jgi:3-oxoacyl-[acyl-carrier-protein] synthase I
VAAPKVAVVGVGMVTAVGLSAAETAASVRAGTMRFSETSFMDRRFEPFTLAEVPEDGLPELVEALDRPGLTSREGRMLRLAAIPLLECLQALPLGEPRPPLHLALPETETTLPLDGARFLAALTAQAGAHFDANRSVAKYRGRAGGVAAIGGAAAAVAAGARFAIGGGVDTYRDLYVLGTLDMEGRVKSSGNLNGFIPGEGAAFLLLTSDAVGAELGLPVLGRISAAVAGSEPGHLYSEEPYRGDGLAATVRALLDSGAAPAPIQEVYSSMNGESHWAKEWGVTFLRNRSAFDDDHGMHHPADCYGDLGAAGGPAMAGMAAVGVRAGYRKAPCLVYGSSDRGDRAALVVTSA